jgi:hypothetical protein
MQLAGAHEGDRRAGHVDGPCLSVLTDDGHPGKAIRLRASAPGGTVLVVVLAVDSRDLLQMPSPDDQEPVKAVSADRTDPPFRVRVRLGAAPA